MAWTANLVGKFAAARRTQGEIFLPFFKQTVKIQIEKQA